MNQRFKHIKTIAVTHKTLIQNFSYLSALQIFNLVLPLISYPYLIRTLGADKYGLIIYAQAIIGYFVLLINFGFNINATKDISLNRHNKEKISEIVSSVFIIKIGLLVISLMLLFGLSFFVASIKSNLLLFILTMWMCLYETFFPIYYFQGIEKMKYITIINLISRSIFLLFIFILIKNPNDFLLVPTINGIGAIFASIASIIILKKDKIKFQLQPISTLIGYLKRSYVMALAYASNSFKSNLNLIIIKYLFSYQVLSYYDLAQKITQVGITFLDLINQTVFPKMSREKNKVFFMKSLKLTVLLSVMFVIFIQVFGEKIVLLLGGFDMLAALRVLRLLVFFVPIYIAGSLFGRNCLIVYGFDKFVLTSMMYSSLINIIIIGVMYYCKFEITILHIVISYIVSYLVETLYRYWICSKKQIL